MYAQSPGKVSLEKAIQKFKIRAQEKYRLKNLRFPLGSLRAVTKRRDSPPISRKVKMTELGLTSKYTEGRIINHPITSKFRSISDCDFGSGTLSGILRIIAG